VSLYGSALARPSPRGADSALLKIFIESVIAVAVHYTSQWAEAP